MVQSYAAVYGISLITPELEEDASPFSLSSVKSMVAKLFFLSLPSLKSEVFYFLFEFKTIFQARNISLIKVSVHCYILLYVLYTLFFAHMK